MSEKQKGVRWEDSFFQLLWKQLIRLKIEQQQYNNLLIECKRKSLSLKIQAGVIKKSTPTEEGEKGKEIRVAEERMEEDHEEGKKGEKKNEKREKN